MTLTEAARVGRQDGARQIGGGDCMKFPSNRHWSAYVTGFYRGHGYEGSGNRSQRKRTD